MDGGNKSMKKKIIGILICGLLIANVSAVLGSSGEKISLIEKTELPRGNVAGMGPNLAPNPSFEEGGTMPTGWTNVSALGDVKGSYHWDSSDAHSGSKSVGIYKIENSRASYWHLPLTNLIPVDLVNFTYEFSVWYKFNKIPANVNQWGALEFGMYDKDKNFISYFYFRLPPSLNWTYTRVLTSYSGIAGNMAKTKYIDLRVEQFDAAHGSMDKSVEVRFDDVFFGIGGINNPPAKPSPPTGETKGRVGTYYNFSAITTDPDGDCVRYNFSWGDGNYSGWSQYSLLSGEICTVSHNWSVKGNYEIKVQAEDRWGLVTDWSDPLTITMPYSHSRSIPQCLELLFDRFPNAFPLLRQLRG
jgi:hypothetical protein